MFLDWTFSKGPFCRSIGLVDSSGTLSGAHTSWKRKPGLSFQEVWAPDRVPEESTRPIDLHKGPFENAQSKNYFWIDQLIKFIN